MKIEKTASGSQKITMSKDEWSLIGKQAGWAESQDIKMNNLDWGKTTEERNSNMDKYYSLKTEEERKRFLGELKSRNTLGNDGNQEGGGFEEPGEGIEPQDGISPEITRKMLKNRLDIAEAALWIMADKVLEEDFVFDENMTPTDLVMECRRLAITKGKG
jgi:hypothetical protein